MPTSNPLPSYEHGAAQGVLAATALGLLFDLGLALAATESALGRPGRG